MTRIEAARGSRVRRALLCAAMGGIACIAQAVAAGPSRAGETSSRLIVRYLDEGPAAVEECGVRLHEIGSHVGGTADRSDSLDRLHRRFGVRRVRALLRNGEAGSLQDQRARLETRARETRDRLGPDRAAAPPGRGQQTSPHAGSTPALRRIRAHDEARLRAMAGRLAHVYEIELEPGADARAAADAYAADPHVAWARVDGVRVLDAIGDDPFLSSFGSWGQPYANLWGHERIRAQEAWDDSRGEGTVVAVIDTGLDWHHEDIAENVWVNPGEDLDGNGRVDEDDWNGVDDDGNGFIDDIVGFDFANSTDGNGDGDYVDPEDTSDPDPFDDNGHGTHVAGIVAAVSGNGVGIAGVAPAARIMALKGFKADGENSDALLWRAVLYAALNGAQVVNNSWSCGAPCPRNPLAEEVVELVHAMGVVIVTSAGNRSRDVVAFSPENMWQTLTVGSSNVFDEPSSSFTNYGFGMDVLAPGGGPQGERGVLVPRRNILSLRSSAADSNQAPFVVGEHYMRMAGTSMAAPQVAGAAALLLAQRPWLGPDAVRRMIRRSAHDLDRPGHDHATGAGRLDVRALLDEPDPPDWLVRVVSPRPSSWFDPTVEDVIVEGTIVGPDLESYVVRVGQGEQPEAWIEIADSSTPVEDGQLATWSLAGVAPGAWVVHVEARAIDGRLAHEYIPVSTERLQFAVLSSDGPAAERPAIAGGRVVWQSRRGRVEDPFGRFDYDLFESTLFERDGFEDDRGGDEERRLLDRAGDQTQPAISLAHRAATVSWLDQAPEASETRAHACRVDPLTRHCEPISLAPGERVTLAPAPLRDRVYWLDGSSGELDVRGCWLERDGGRCRPFDVGLDPARRGWLEGDGRGTLTWSAVTDGSGIALCRVGIFGGCRETRITPPQLAYTRSAASGDLAVWVAPRFSGDRPLLACIVGDEGDCDPIAIVPHAEDARPRVSGDLVVWDGTLGDEAADVFFCEFDRLRQRCPVQRLTSELSTQSDSDIDGRRVVWVDERFGPGRVVGVRLPNWREIRPRRAHVGQPMTVVAWLDQAGHGPAVVTADQGAAEGAASIHVTPLRRPGRAPLERVLLRWCPTDADVGEQVLTLTARGEDGLATRTSFAVHVEAAPTRGGRWRWRTRAAHGLRTCESRP